MSNTSKIIKNYRIASHMTQTQVALNLDCSSQFFGAIELGSARLPARLVRPVAELLEIPKKSLENAMVADYRAQLRQDALHTTHR